MKYKHIIVVICILAAHIAKAQGSTVQQLIATASLPSSVIRNGMDLKVRISVKNKSDFDINVYKFLVEGYDVDASANLNLLIQQKGNKGFHEYSRGSLYQLAPQDPGDPIEKVKLKPKDSLVHYFHLDDAYLFVPGNYRLKCFYRNDITQKDRISTSWIYFQVIDTIRITHHYND